MKAIGILGGLGPEASNKFCELLISNKTAARDQDHLDFIHYCNAKIPSRINYIRGRSKDSPIPKMIDVCQNLEKMGVGCIVVPCNTVHSLLPEVQREINVPIIDMILLLVNKMKRENPEIKKVGLLGTTLTNDLRLYESYLNKIDVEVIKLEKELQSKLIMKSINAIKAGEKNISRGNLLTAAKMMIEMGAEGIIFGCTEIPLVLEKKDFEIPIYEPMETCAREIIRYSEIMELDDLFDTKISKDKEGPGIVPGENDDMEELNILESKNA